jgi:tellurite methyltransferase
VKCDREKWDERYAKQDHGLPTADPFLEGHRHLLTSGMALDIAAGFGGNALFVAALGYRVHALDISLRALSVLQAEAQRQKRDLQCIVADLDSFPLPKDHYDLVMVFYFHATSLMASINDCLRPGGLLFYVTYNHRHQSLRPDFCPDYLVPPGGLTRFFPELSILVDEPEAGRDRNISRLIARKP